MSDLQERMSGDKISKTGPVIKGTLLRPAHIIIVLWLSLPFSWAPFTSQDKGTVKREDNNDRGWRSVKES